MNFWENFLCSGTIIECAEHFMVGSGKRTWVKEEQKGECTFYFPDFFLENTHPFFFHEEVRAVPKDKLSDVLSTASPRAIVWSDPDYENYERQYEQLFSLLETNVLKKGVPYSVKKANLKEIPISDILSAALNNKGHAFLYGFWDKQEGMIGVTPEILFEKNPEGIFLEALAGTKVNAPFMPKEDVEHQIVIDGIQEALLPFGKVHVFPTRSIPYGNLIHLRTPLRLETEKNITFLDLVKSLHPTPALGTYPKDKGLPWLKEIDALIPRGRFGAPAGFTQNDHFRCLVAIRNIQWKDGEVLMAAGGGVTIDSKKESEWEEILRKQCSIQKMLSI